MYHAPMFFLQTGTLFVFLIPYDNGLALKNPVLWSVRLCPYKMVKISVTKWYLGRGLELHVTSYNMLGPPRKSRLFFNGPMHSNIPIYMGLDSIAIQWKFQLISSTNTFGHAFGHVSRQVDVKGKPPNGEFLFNKSDEIVGHPISCKTYMYIYIYIYIYIYTPSGNLTLWHSYWKRPTYSWFTYFP